RGAAGAALPPALEQEVQSLREALGDGVPCFLVRRLLLDVGGYTETRLSRQHPELGHLLSEGRRRLAAAGCAVPAVEARTRYGWVRHATAGWLPRPPPRPPP